MTYAFVIIFLYETLSFVPITMEEMDDHSIICVGGICHCGSTTGWYLPEATFGAPLLPKQCIVFSLVKEGQSFGVAMSLANAANNHFQGEAAENPAIALYNTRKAIPTTFPVEVKVVMDQLHSPWK